MSHDDIIDSAPLFRVAIYKGKEPNPFWRSKKSYSIHDARRVKEKNERLIKRQKWDHTVVIEDV